MVFIGRITTSRILAYGENSHTLAKYVVLLVIYFSIMLPSFASDMTTHYIVAFDQRVPNYTWLYNDSNILNRIDRMLDGQYDSANDYLSVVGYAFDSKAPSIENFVLPFVTNEGMAVLWYKKGDTSLRQLLSGWSARFPQRGNSSLQSLAKPYVVMATKNDSLYSDRIVLLLVTDEEINGADDNWYSEWNNLSTSDGANHYAMERMRDATFSRARCFNESFSFREMNDDNDPFHRDVIYGDYKIVPYAVTATDRLSFYGATDMPSLLPLRRVRGGYRINMEIHSTNKAYIPCEFLLTRGTTLCDTLVYSTYMMKGGMTIDTLIPSRHLSVGDSLTTSMSLSFKDGLYDGCLISYRNPEYRAGMSIKQEVKLDDKAKVLGLLPLADIFWWWFPNDVVMAVMVWDVIILLILIIVVVWLFYRWFVRINTYTPNDEDIKIGKI